MDYYVKRPTVPLGDESSGKVFSTIQQAAELARPGDTIWIGEGVYREWVRPRRGGSDDLHRIVYRNMPGEQAVISGAEEITHWDACGSDTWKAVLPNDLLGAYNPYEDEIFGDWYDNFGQVHHTGEVFMDDAALYEAPDLAHIKQTDRPERKYSWFAEVSEIGVTVWVYLPGLNPNEHRMEASVRPYCFFPETEGMNYITVSGLVIEKAATQWAPPTAFQPGAIGVHWSKGWIIENCTVRHSKCSGISLGKRREERDNIWSYDPSKSGTQTYTEQVFANLKRDWSKERVGSHVIRNNEIYACGQAGIVGCMGGAFSVISGNHIHDVNNRQEFGGAEMAGIKLHAAIDVQLEDNLIHDCIRGLWLDWEAQGTRVSRNAFFANSTEDIFIEVCHGPCTVENNLLLSKYSLSNASQGIAYVHNLFAGKTRMMRDPGRFTMYHFPHDTFVAGLMVIYGGDDKIAGNMYVGNGAEDAHGNAIYDGYPTSSSQLDMPDNGLPMAYADSTLPVFIRDNLYFCGAKPYAKETGAVETSDFPVTLRIVHTGGQYVLETNLPEYLFAANLNLTDSTALGKSFQSDAAYENADGTPFTLDRDYMGTLRGEKTIPGPFAAPLARIPLNPDAKTRRIGV